LAVWKCAEADRLLPSKSRGRPDPIFGLAVTGGRLSPELGDLPTAAVEPVSWAVGRQENDVHEAVLLPVRVARMQL